MDFELTMRVPVKPEAQDGRVQILFKHESCHEDSKQSKETQAPTNPFGRLPRLLAAAIQPLERKCCSRASVSARLGMKRRLDVGQISKKTMQLRCGQSTISSFAPAQNSPASSHPKEQGNSALSPDP